MAASDERARISAALYEVAEDRIIREWICCDPVDVNHTLCMQGNSARLMIKELLVDNPNAHDSEAPLLNVVMMLIASYSDRLARIAQAHSKNVGAGGMTDGCCIECGEPWGENGCPTYVWATTNRNPLETWDPDDDEE